MALDYASLSATALRLISENGRSVTIHRPSRTPADSNKSWGVRQTDAVAADEINITTIGVFIDSEIEERGVITPLTSTGSLVEGNATKVLLSADPALPSEVGPDWYLIDGTKRWEIITIKPIRPGGTLVFYSARLAA